MPQLGQIIGCLSGIPSLQGNVLSPVAKNLRHPDQLLQELVNAFGVTGVENLPVGVKQSLHIRKVSVPEDVDQPELAHHGEQVLNHARASEAAGRNATDAHRLVDV